MKHVILIKLEIEAPSFDDAITAVESILDVGTFQDEINALHEDTGGNPVMVVSALCEPGE